VRFPQHAFTRGSRIGGPIRQQCGGEGARRRSLSDAGGAVEEIRVGGAPLGGSPRAEHHARMRMRLCGEQQIALEGGCGRVTLRRFVALHTAHRIGALPSQPVERGRLITIEGLDGAGKSTLAHALCARLRESHSRVELLREPGGVGLSERIRALVKDPQLQVSARAEALLYAAARAELVQERVLPLLEQGTIVLLDRFVDSSLAYQGAGRALGMAQVRAVNLFATGDLAADRTLLLRISPSAARARQGGRGSEPDRLEREGERFFAAIGEAYDLLAQEEPQRIRVIDAGRSPLEVLRQALEAIEDIVAVPSDY
jgi:dTMP kinase